MNLTKAFNKQLIEKGQKIDKSLNANKDKYTLLAFLNENYLDGKYHDMINQDDIEMSVKKAIKAYLKDITENYKKRLDKNKILEIKNGQYIHLNKEVTIEKDGSDNLNAVLSDYVWNATYAMTQ